MRRYRGHRPAITTLHERRKHLGGKRRRRAIAYAPLVTGVRRHHQRGGGLGRNALSGRLEC